MIEPTRSRVYDAHLSTAFSVVNFRQRKPAAPPQPHPGCAPSLCRLSAARKQRRRSGRESRLSADGWSGRVLGAGIPQLLSTRPSSVSVHAPEVTHSTAFSEMSGGSSYHACSQAIESPHLNSFDFEGDSDLMRLTVEGLLFNGICLLCSQGSHSLEMLENLKFFIFKPRKAWE